MSDKFDQLLKAVKETGYTFNCELLSQKDTITFRPTKTKDQKILIVLKEEAENKELQIFTTILTFLDQVVLKNKIPFDKWTEEDLAWVLINVKMKSTGETIDLSVPCPHCGKRTDVTINLLTDVTKTHKSELKDNVIKINDSTFLTLDHITLTDIFKILELSKDVEEAKDLFTKAAYIRSAEIDEQIIDLTLEQKEKLLEEFSKEQLEKMINFAEVNKFGIELKKKWKCSNKECGKDSEFKMRAEDIINFF